MGSFNELAESGIDFTSLLKTEKEEEELEREVNSVLAMSSSPRSFVTPPTSPASVNQMSPKELFKQKLSPSVYSEVEQADEVKRQHSMVSQVVNVNFAVICSPRLKNL